MKFVKLKDISVNNRGYYGIGASAVDYNADKYTYLRITDINDDGSLNKKNLMSVDDEKANQYLLQKNDIVFARTGASAGRNYFYDGEIENMVYAGFLIKFSLNSNLVNPRYIKYYCLSQKYNNWILSSITGSTRPNINEKQLADMPIELPEREYQDKVVKIIDALTNKIKLNNEINNNLSEQIKCIYNEMFTEYDSYKRLSEISNVTIGKTPPRSESECFTTDEKDIKWISISDLGKAGMFIFDTSERLTHDAIAKYNVKIIPQNTVLLSFKLTIGRTGFTTENMATNEAIAHFDLFNKNLNNYLYCTLTYFNYSDLGSTSSIATAINSKIVKSIKIGIPNEKQLNKFNDLTSSMFKIIRNNEYENIKLSELRDTLLPKLMNGEIDLDNIEI